MTVAVVGNSHTAALRLGAGDEADATWYAAPGQGMRDFGLEGDALVPRTPELRRHVERSSGSDGVLRPAEVDAVVVVGLPSLRPVMGRFEEHRLFGHEGPGTSLVSRACLDAAVAGTISKSAMGRVVAAVRSISDVPLVAVSAPRPAPWIDVRPRGGLLYAEPALVAEAIACVERVAADYVVPVVLPPEQLHDGLFTRGDYARGATRVTGELHGHADAMHMNADYGRVIWAEVLRTLGAAPTTL